VTDGDGITRRAVLGGAGGLLFAPWWIRWRAEDRPTTLWRLTRRPLAGFGTTAISVRDAAGDVRSACVLVADTAARRARGLMEVTRPQLRGYGGMLFVFESEQERGFWMRNTPMPLSIAFFAADGRFVSSADMTPCGDSPDCPRTSSQGRAQYALEMPQGMLPSLGIGTGSVLTIAGSCSSLRA